MRIPVSSSALLLALCVIEGPGLAQLTRLGGEFQANSYTSNEQRLPAVASDDRGGFVIVWESLNQDSSGSGVFANRFDSAGARQGVEFQVNTVTAGDQLRPVTAMDRDGDFVVAWQSSTDGSSSGILAQRFDSAGARQAGEFQVNTYTPGIQQLPSVSMAPGGEFVVAWDSENQDGQLGGIFARRFNAAGVAQAGEFLVNSYTAFTQSDVDVAMTAGGAFVIAWGSQFQDGTGSGIFARRFDAGGVAQATEFQVNTYTGSSERRPEVAWARSGGFVVVWTTTDGHDGDGYGVSGQRFNAAGSRQGAEIQINIFLTGSQRAGDVAADNDGDFVVTWPSDNQDGNLTGVFARRFNATTGGQPFESQVNSYVTSNQLSSAIAMTPAGDFVIAWQGSNLQDGSGDGIFAQRFAGFTLDVDGDGVFGPLTDALLVLRYAFGFRGATLITGAIGVDCTRCTAADIEAFLDSVI